MPDGRFKEGVGMLRVDTTLSMNTESIRIRAWPFYVLDGLDTVVVGKDLLQHLGLDIHINLENLLRRSTYLHIDEMESECDDGLRLIPL
jgi:hypothetical protein